MKPPPDISARINDRFLRIWSVVRRIPRGRVSTYGAIAGLAGLPRGARTAGSALSNLPEGSGVPWHRVVNSAGRSSLPSAGGRSLAQLRMLAAEGVPVRNGRVDLRTAGWPASVFRTRRG